jgi:hypothetical protein
MINYEPDKDFLIRTTRKLKEKWELAILNNETTQKVLHLLDMTTKTALSNELGITRPTLDSRLLGESKWKVLEVKWINNLSDIRNN